MLNLASHPRPSASKHLYNDYSAKPGSRSQACICGIQLAVLDHNHYNNQAATRNQKGENKYCKQSRR